MEKDDILPIDMGGIARGKFYFDAEHKALLDIVSKKRITTVFQPIFDLNRGVVYGYEALSRVSGRSPFDGPEDLFAAARSCGITPRLERLCHETAIKSSQTAGIEGLLCLNVCPSILQPESAFLPDSAFVLDYLYSQRERLVLELTEKFCITNNAGFKAAVDMHRRQGFRIGVDDLGSGYAGLRILSELDPVIVKVDRSLIAKIELSTRKQLLLSCLVNFCHRINALVVAEGIETMEELRCVMSIKADLAQGYFLAPPQEKPQDCDYRIKELVRDQARKVIVDWQAQNHVGSLAQYVEPVAAGEPVQVVSRRFNHECPSCAIPVLDGTRPVGIIHKDRLFYQLGQRFGYDLFSKKPVSEIMDKALVFEAATPLEEVTRQILLREESAVYDAVVVVLNGSYLGLVKVHSILDNMTRQKIANAMQANPLTGLPGNNLIKEEISSRLAAKEIFAVLYFDLDNFKPFNDNFGFGSGDNVIRCLGNLVRDRVLEWDTKAFVGHVGGDDFVAVCAFHNVEELCRQIVARFDREALGFHDQDTRTKGFYESRDRLGNVQRFSLLSLSIAVVSTVSRSFESYAHLTSVATEVKKKAKSIAGSSYFIDRRRD